MKRTIALIALLATLTLTTTPTEAHHRRDQRAALEWIAALWAYLGYNPNYLTPTGQVCPWGPAIERSFSGSGLDGRYMTSIAWRESRCGPGAVSPTNDHGLLQINRINVAWTLRAAGCTNIYDPNCNSAAGVKLAQEAARIWGDPYRPWAATR